jgi:hypothetical protein
MNKYYRCDNDNDYDQDMHIIDRFNPRALAMEEQMIIRMETATAVTDNTPRRDILQAAILHLT